MLYDMDIILSDVYIHLTSRVCELLRLRLQDIPSPKFKFTQCQFSACSIAKTFQKRVKNMKCTWILEASARVVCGRNVR